MKVRKNFLCWLLLVVMFCVAASCGCGGGHHDNFADDTTNEENVTPEPAPTPEPDTPPTPTPDTPEPAPVDDRPTPAPNTGTIEGTWRIDSGTLNFSENGFSFTANYIAGSASVEQFNISLSPNTNNSYYTIALSNTGGLNNEVTASFSSELTGDMEDISVISGGDSFALTGNNTYTFERSAGGYGISMSIQLTDASTIRTTLYNLTNTTINMTLKRVN